jgi:hypothetical protein
MRVDEVGAHVEQPRNGLQIVHVSMVELNWMVLKEKSDQHGFALRSIFAILRSSGGLLMVLERAKWIAMTGSGREAVACFPRESGSWSKSHG